MPATCSLSSAPSSRPSIFEIAGVEGTEKAVTAKKKGSHLRPKTHAHPRMGLRVAFVA